MNDCFKRVPACALAFSFPNLVAGGFLDEVSCHYCSGSSNIAHDLSLVCNVFALQLLPGWGINQGVESLIVSTFITESELLGQWQAACTLVVISAAYWGIGGTQGLGKCGSICFSVSTYALFRKHYI